MYWTVLIAFGLLAVGAVAATWRDDDVRPVGYAIVGAFVVSNLSLTYMAAPEWPAGLTVAEVLISSTAFVCRMTHGPRTLVLVVIASMISVCSNVAIAALGSHVTIEQLRLWVLVTNVCYVVECLLVIYMGVRQRVGNGGLPRGITAFGLPAARHARSRR